MLLAAFLSEIVSITPSPVLKTSTNANGPSLALGFNPSSCPSKHPYSTFHSLKPSLLGEAPADLSLYPHQGAIVTPVQCCLSA